MAASYHVDPEKVKGDLSSYGRAAKIGWCFIIPFNLLGIIGDAADINVGLEPVSWFLLAIGCMLASIFFRIISSGHDNPAPLSRLHAVVHIDVNFVPSGDSSGIHSVPAVRRELYKN